MLTKKQQVRRSNREIVKMNVGVTNPGTGVEIKKLGSPKFVAKVNGVSTIGTFDGGCTACSISLDLVRQLGITTLKKTSTIHLMADGTRSKALGVASDLKIEIEGVLVARINATVFDQEDYSLLLGRYFMESIAIGTDWSSNFWYHKQNDRVLPIPVFYDNDILQAIVESKGGAGGGVEGGAEGGSEGSSESSEESSNGEEGDSEGGEMYMVNGEKMEENVTR